jgi:hypothetical protein
MKDPEQDLRLLVRKEIQSLKDGLDTNAPNAAKVKWCEETEDNIMDAIASQATAAQEQAVLEARIDENKSIESMLEDVIADERDCCHNHEKYYAPCYGCRIVRWRKTIAKEYLTSINDRLASLPQIEQEQQ